MSGFEELYVSDSSNDDDDGGGKVKSGDETGGAAAAAAAVTHLNHKERRRRGRQLARDVAAGYTIVGTEGGEKGGGGAAAGAGGGGGGTRRAPPMDRKKQEQRALMVKFSADVLPILEKLKCHIKYVRSSRGKPGIIVELSPGVGVPCARFVHNIVDAFNTASTGLQGNPIDIHLHFIDPNNFKKFSLKVDFGTRGNYHAGWKGRGTEKEPWGSSGIPPLVEADPRALAMMELVTNIMDALKKLNLKGGRKTRRNKSHNKRKTRRRHKRRMRRTRRHKRKARHTRRRRTHRRTRRKR